MGCIRPRVPHLCINLSLEWTSGLSLVLSGVDLWSPPRPLKSGSPACPPKTGPLALPCALGTGLWVIVHHNLLGLNLWLLPHPLLTGLKVCFSFILAGLDSDPSIASVHLMCTLAGWAYPTHPLSKLCTLAFPLSHPLRSGLQASPLTVLQVPSEPDIMSLPHYFTSPQN